MAQELLAVGARFPDYDLVDQHGGRHTAAELARGTWVLWFYPQDETPGCTRQACELRDQASWFAERGVGLLGVSADDAASHGAFATHHRLPMPLLADVGHRLCDAVGVWGLQTWGAHTWEGIARTTFVVRDGQVVAVIAPVDVATHFDTLRGLLEG